MKIFHPSIVLLTFLSFCALTIAQQKSEHDTFNTADSGVKASGVKAALVVGQERMLIAQAKGIVLHQLHSAAEQVVLRDVDVKSFAKGPAGMVYAACADASVLQSNDSFDKWTVVKRAETGFDSKSDVNLHVAEDNVIYLIAGSVGLYRSIDDGKTWMSMNDEDIAGSEIRCMTLAGDGTVFIGTEHHGVMRFNESTRHWEGYGANALEVPQVESLCVGMNGEVFAGAANDVYILTSERAHWKRTTLFEAKSSQTGSRVFALTVDEAKRVLAASTAGLFVSNDQGQTWKYVESEKDQPHCMSGSGSDIMIIDQHGIKTFNQLQRGQHGSN